MLKWLLIITIYSCHGSFGCPPDVPEPGTVSYLKSFETEDACKSVGDEVAKSAGYIGTTTTHFSRLSYVCVQEK